MSGIRIMLLSLLSVVALGSAASTAAAELNGPSWRHPEAKGSQKQVKYPLNETELTRIENEGPFFFKSKALGIPLTFECKSLTSNNAGIFNGPHQGKGASVIEVKGCFLLKLCPEVEVEVEPLRVYSELQWKYAGDQKELKEAGQQKIYDVFIPLQEGSTSTLFTTITIPAACKSVSGEFNVEATGSPTLFVDENQHSRESVLGPAAQVEPQGRAQKILRLNWASPNVTELHHKTIQTKAGLTFAGNPMELEGKLKLERINEEEFGAFAE
jgi:hypothetical protein